MRFLLDRLPVITQPMQSRFALRIESGDHAGEVVPLAGQKVTIGRRPENTFQLGDSSVSGRHAEFLVQGDAVVLRDLGSTNGTKVGASSVDGEQSLAHGDEILLGHVRLRFEDSEFDGAAPEIEFPRAASAPVGLEVGGELAQTQVHQISAEKVARSSKRSIVALLGVALLVGGGGAAWYFLTQGGGAPGAALRPVVAVDGNLLSESYSFEPPPAEGGGVADPGWETADDAPAGFLVSGAAAASGEAGLFAPLAAGEWAEHRSEIVRVQGTVEAQAALAASGSAEVRLGLRFSSSSDSARSMVTWSPAIGTDKLEPRFLSSTVPAGYDRARVVIRASAPTGDGGDVRVDDVSLITTGGANAPASSGEYKLSVVGDPGDVASVFKINRVLLSSLRITRAEGERASLSAVPHDVGLALSSTGGDRFAVFVENALLSRIGTTGAEGYRAHRENFEAEAVTGLLLGEGVDLVRLRFEYPVKVSGRPEGDGFAIEVESSPDAVDADGNERPRGEKGFMQVVLQVEFGTERAEAAGLARTAREAERNGELGPALASWQRLLDEFPYEDALFQQGSEARSRLVQDGLERLNAVRTEVERADFFGLPDLYRQSRDEVVATAELFAGSEIEGEARTLIASIDEELAVLEQDLYAAEIERLRAIHTMLELGEMPQLAERVSTYLDERFNVEGDR